MPGGYLTTVLILGLCVLLMLAPPSRSRLLGSLSFWAGLLVNEQPHWFALGLAGATGLAFAEGDLDSGAGWAAVALAAATIVGLAVLLARSFESRPVLRSAVAELDPQAVVSLGGSRSHLRSLAAPLAFGRRGVERDGNVAYGPAPGRANLLDVYRPRNGEVTGPTLVYLHGGHFRRGDKRREAMALHYRLARRGWVVISANYQLNPAASFPAYLIDLKRVIAWSRSEGLAYGLDPGRILLAGGSAGAHIAAMAALTPGRPELQPGFERADTSVSGVVALYGYYGRLEASGQPPRAGLSSSPRDHVHPGAPPFLVVHGTQDSLVSPAGAKALTADLRAAGTRASFAGLPGAQHSFDLLRSVRTDNLTDAIEDFARVL